MLLVQGLNGEIPKDNVVWELQVCIFIYPCNKDSRTSQNSMNLFKSFY